MAGGSFFAAKFDFANFKKCLILTHHLTFQLLKTVYLESNFLDMIKLNFHMLNSVKSAISVISIMRFMFINLNVVCAKSRALIVLLSPHKRLMVCF